VTSAARLLARQGYAATPVQRIAADGAAPMGSFYFHFPGGKEELGVAALRHGAGSFARLLTAAFADGPSVVDALPQVARWLARDLQESDWADGCPVATTALEAVTLSPPLRAAAAEAFSGWEALLRESLQAGGVPEPAAAGLATTALALLEGAEMLARVHGSTEPLDRAATALGILTAAALPGSHAEGSRRD
jgi:TetR/AcrR family transcriptional regulator, lmrAB and yxaGH operons repressor